MAVHDINLSNSSTDASDVTYDNTTSGLESTNVQNAIDESLQTVNSQLSDMSDRIDQVASMGGVSYVQSSIESLPSDVDYPISFLPESSSGGGSSIEYNDKLYFIFGRSFASGSRLYSYSMYSFNGTAWSQEPNSYVNAERRQAVVYQNKIHCFGGSNSSTSYQSHTTFDGTTWTSVATTPFSGPSVGCVYNNYIYGLSQGGRTLSVFDGTSWTSTSDIPTFPDTSGVYSMCVYNNMLYASAYNKVYMFDGETWTYKSKVTTTSNLDGQLTSTDDELFFSSTIGIYKYTGTGWTSISDNTSKLYEYSGTSFWNTAGIYKNQPCLFGGYEYQGIYPPCKGFIVYDGTKWKSLGLPYQGGNVVKYQNNLYFQQGYGNASSYSWQNNLFRYDTDGWVYESKLSTDQGWALQIEHQGKLHFIGSVISSYKSKHCTYDGETWTTLSNFDSDYIMNINQKNSAISYSGVLYVFSSNGYIYYYNNNYWYRQAAPRISGTSTYVSALQTADVHNGLVYVGSGSTIYTMPNLQPTTSAGYLYTYITTPVGAYYMKFVDNDLHILTYDATSRYLYRDGEWKSCTELPTNTTNSTAIIPVNHKLRYYNQGYSKDLSSPEQFYSLFVAKDKHIRAPIIDDIQGDVQKISDSDYKVLSDGYVEFLSPSPYIVAITN